MQDNNSNWCICVPKRVTAEEYVGVSQSETGDHVAEVVLENNILTKIANGGRRVPEFVHETTEASGLAFEEIPFNLGDRVAVWSAGRQVWYEDGTVKDVGPCGVQVLYNSGSYKKTVPHTSTLELLRKPGDGTQALPTIVASDKELDLPVCGDGEPGDWRGGVCESLAATPFWSDALEKPHDAPESLYSLHLGALYSATADVTDDSARSTRTVAAHEFRLSFALRGPKGSPHAGTNTFIGVSQLQLFEASPAPSTGRRFLFVTPFQCDGKPSLMLGGLIGPADGQRSAHHVLELHVLDADKHEIFRSFRCGSAEVGSGHAGCGCTIA